MAGIGVVGAGISGLTLALRLQQLGVDVTLYSEGDAGSLRSGRPRPGRTWRIWCCRRSRIPPTGGR
ncbi:hypothetical protein GCM10022419_132260 [Nonomuraea rosea]|uniref:FAD dependent oxidoreductase domain-containing protein n=1 Tax=Nonomuraea rosea TaxID=638574 RepID=A0ABP7A3H5_9ACTN